MIVKPNKKTFLGIFKSLYYGLRGIKISICDDPGVQKIVLLNITILLLVYCTKKKISALNIILCFISIGVELNNTCSEQILDIVEPNYSPLVRDAKDTSAGYVFIIHSCIIFLQFYLN